MNLSGASSEPATRLCPRCGAHGRHPMCASCASETIPLPGGPDDPDSLVGAVVGGKYAVGSVLGHGGMGTVYRGAEQSTGLPVAIKVMRSDVATDGAAVERFKREARLSSQLEHPNIIRQFDYGVTDNGLMFLVMELLTGRELADEIAESGTLTVARALGIAGRIVDALRLAHNLDIVHRDLKPGNIFMARRDDGSEVAKVMDFGIAKSLDDGAPQVTQAGVVVGTPAYMSPEQAKSGKLTANSDVYAVGIILYEMLTGAVPFQSESLVSVLMMQVSRQPPPLRERRPDLANNTALQSLLDAMLDKTAENRPDSATAVGRLAELARAAPRPAVVVAADDAIDDEATAFMQAMADPEPLATVRVDGAGSEDEATAFVDAMVGPGPVATVRVSDGGSEDEATAFVDAVDAPPPRPSGQSAPAALAALTVSAAPAADDDAATVTAMPAQAATVVGVPAAESGDQVSQPERGRGSKVAVFAAVALVAVVGLGVGGWLIMSGEPEQAAPAVAASGGDERAEAVEEAPPPAASAAEGDVRTGSLQEVDAGSTVDAAQAAAPGPDTRVKVVSVPSGATVSWPCIDCPKLTPSTETAYPGPNCVTDIASVWVSV